jgi:hypothetical protein
MRSRHNLICGDLKSESELTLSRCVGRGFSKSPRIRQLQLPHKSVVKPPNFEIKLKLAATSRDLLVVAQVGNHVKKFFKRDKTAAMSQFVLVDGFRKLRDVRPN